MKMEVYEGPHLSPEQADTARKMAFLRMVTNKHPNPTVGIYKYHSELRLIDDLEKRA